MIELKAASVDDGRDIFDMLVEIGPGENGFVNSAYDIDYSQFPAFIRKNIAISQGIDLLPQHVPQTVFWLFVDSYPVGYGKLRHYLNDNLKISGGHIGYTIRPSKRGKGYGTVMLNELLKNAENMGIKDVMLSCVESNIASRRVIELNNGVLEANEGGKCNYWIHI
ncbi:GNAT family N-acetyltransferase [Paenibacillus sp. 2TAB26]|uniref:GNAT family N-acetyltransferase n=1 Tax=Paenibacillus sp. 2TAB26 TaxID=3233005 RepID=UPI003F954532